MRTFFEYTSRTAQDPRYKMDRPNCCDCYSSFVEHDERCSEEEVLEFIFGICNHGSPFETSQFAVTRIPSLSVGDTVKLGQGHSARVYLCNSFGWTALGN